MHQPHGHRVKDQEQQNHAETEKEEAEGTGNALPTHPFVPNPILVEPVFGDQAVVPASSFVEKFVLRYPTGENHSVHREFLDPEMGVEEMNRKDESGREQGFIRMNYQRHVNQPARQKTREEGGKPHDQTGGADDEHAPKDGEVIEFLPIGPAIELGLGTLTEEPLVMGHEIAPVLNCG